MRRHSWRIFDLAKYWRPDWCVCLDIYAVLGVLVTFLLQIANSLSVPLQLTLPNETDLEEKVYEQHAKSVSRGAALSKSTLYRKLMM